MMRAAVFLALLILLSGCITEAEPANATENQTEINATENQTEINETENQTEVQEPSRWERHYAEGFSFEYPLHMDTDDAQGLFSGEYKVEDETMELMVVMYFNASNVYGINQDKVFQDKPSQAATDLLLSDMEDDPIYMLDDAEKIGGITEFSIGRDAYVSYAPYEIKFFEGGKTYYGHAVSIYVPARSQHIKVRIIARNPDISQEIKSRFFQTFRLE